MKYILTASLALNLSLAALLWVNAGRLAPTTPGNLREQESASSSEMEEASEICPEKLRRCEAGKQVLERNRRETPGLPFVSSAVPEALRPDEELPPDPVVTGIDAEVQQAMLAEVTQKFAREKFEAQREAITAGLRRSLADAEEQERNITNETSTFAKLLGLDEADRGRFEKRYRKERLKLVETAREALVPEPPDYDAVLKTARRLFQTEDSTVEELFGPTAREKVRAAVLEGRITVLVILAVLANKEFDEALGW